MIHPVPHVAAMSPYALADLTVPDGKTLVSLSQNESLRPPSPAVALAVERAMASAQLYPDPDWTALRAQLAEVHGVDADTLLCGNGSMELIAALAHTYADRNHAVLAPAHTYPYFRTATALAGARFDTAPEVDGTVSVDALLAAVQPDTRLVFVANPGNPTGTRIPRAELLRLRESLRNDILLVIDEAYAEFTDHLGEPMFDIVARGDTVVLRTFSKAYGLAGLRVGWGQMPPEIARQVRKVMAPNNISIVGQAAALAALDDQDYMVQTCRMTADARDGFASRLRQVGFDVPQSHTNFVLIRFDGVETAAHADRVLRAEGIFLRPQGGVGLGHCLRATIGAPEQLSRAADVLGGWKEGQDL